MRWTMRWISCLGMAALAVATDARLGSSQAVTALNDESQTPHWFVASLLERPARLTLRDASLATALTRLSESSGVLISFSPSLLTDHDRKVGCWCEENTVSEALDRLLAGTEFHYSVVSGQVILTPDPGPDIEADIEMVPELAPRIGSIRYAFLTSGSVENRLRTTRSIFAQEQFVSGTVVAARSLQPLVGAQVTVEGTDQGALTDDRGRFRIQNVSGQEVTLEVVMLGYRTLTQTVPVGDANVRLALTETAVQLDQIVVTGTAGGSARRALGNSVSQVQAAEIVEIAPITKTGELLNARVPGAIVQSGSGLAGGGPRITIRGASSMVLDAEPLLYVDGVRMENSTATGADDGTVISRLNDINPQDIESIEVIKGPAAATLYGTEAAGGVIQIITKKGRPGDTNFNVDVEQGASWLPNIEDRWVTALYRDDSGQVREMNIPRLERERGTPMFKTGHVQGYGVNASGGSEAVRYYVGVGVNEQQGYSDHNWAQRISARSNLGFTLGRDFDLSTTAFFVKNRVQTTDDSFIDSSLPGNPENLDVPRLRGSWYRRHDLVVETFLEGQDVDRFSGSLQLNHENGSWLSQRLKVGLDYTDQENMRLHRATDDEEVQATFGSFYSDGYRHVDRRTTRYLTLDYNGTVTKNIADGLTSATSVGGQFHQKYIELNYLEGRGFPAFDVIAIAAAAQRHAEQDVIDNVTLGVYLQEQLSWQNRLFLTGAIRADDNSAFGENFDLVTYPKISGAWVLNEEPFWDIDFVDALRLRFAFGASGKQPDAFAALRTFAGAQGFNGQSALVPSAVGNPDLKPERGEELELGFDLGMFSDRLGLDFTFYTQTVRDAIAERQVAPSFGFSGYDAGLQFVNLGELKNQGIELLLTGNWLRSDRVSSELAFNVSYNKNEILDLGDQEFYQTNFSENQHRVGFPVASFFTKHVVGAELDADGNAVNIMCDGGTGTGGVEPGGSPVRCDDAPRLFTGSPLPDWQGSISSTTTFDRFRLYILADFRLNEVKLNGAHWNACASLRVCEVNLYPERFDATTIGAYTLANTQDVSIVYNDASFMKLREVSLAYNVPDAWAATFGASRATVTLSGRNLYTIDDYPYGVDPESIRLHQQQRGQTAVDLGAFPLPTQLITKVNLTF